MLLLDRLAMRYHARPSAVIGLDPASALAFDFDLGVMMVAQRDSGVESGADACPNGYVDIRSMTGRKTG